MTADDTAAVIETLAPKTKAVKAKPAAKKPSAKAKAKLAPSTNGDLTGNETKILTILARANKPLTRADLAAKTGINKGWSKTLGSSSKDNGGMSGKDSLDGRGYVKCELHEGQRSFLYTITARGRKALEAVKG